MAWFWFFFSVRVLEFAIVSVLCHAIIQQLYAQYFLSLRRADCWVNTLSVALLNYIGIVLTSRNATEMLVRGAILTTGLVLGTAFWCSRLEEDL